MYVLQGVKVILSNSRIINYLKLLYIMLQGESNNIGIHIMFQDENTVIYFFR